MRAARRAVLARWRAADRAPGFGNPYPEVFTVAAVRFVDGGVDVVAPRLAEARREFVATPSARYWANVVTGEHGEPRRTGWVLFGLTDLPASG